MFWWNVIVFFKGAGEAELIGAAALKQTQIDIVFIWEYRKREIFHEIPPKAELIYSIA